mgnify:CR=1 FL=1
MTSPRLVIVGPPGSGTSSVGALVAKGLGESFRDTDRLTAAALGYEEVSTAFVNAGEDAFRERELAVALDALSSDGVVTLGSGAILADAVQEVLAALPVVQLTVTLAQAAPRLGLATARPVFLGNPRAQWTRLLAQRQPLYDAAATWSVDTDELTLNEIADEVIRLVKENA